jgi:hypothetical protein
MVWWTCNDIHLSLVMMHPQLYFRHCLVVGIPFVYFILEKYFLALFTLRNIISCFLSMSSPTLLCALVCYWPSCSTFSFLSFPVSLFPFSHVGLLFCPENGGSRFLQNVDGFLPDYMAWHQVAWGRITSDIFVRCLVQISAQIVTIMTRFFVVFLIPSRLMLG